MTGRFVPPDSQERICLRAPNWVGDVVMATPTFRAVRQRRPDAHVTVVVHERVEAVLRGTPWFDAVLTYRPSSRSLLGEFRRCARALKAGRQDLGLILPNSFSSALMFRMGGVARRVGYGRDLRSALLTDAVPRPSEGGRFKPTYMVGYYLGLCEAAGIEPAGRDMELPFNEADAAHADEILRSQGVDPGRDLFLLHPGAGFGPSKRWPSERFSRLAEHLADCYGAQVAVVAGPSERRTVARIVDGARAEVTDLMDRGVDLHLLKCVVARSKLLVTTDSGPRHYGVALGVPTVCVMGPTHPGYSTSEEPHDRVVRLDVDCGPCQKKRCPRDHRCMADITAEMVLEACAAALSDAAGGGTS